MHRCPWPDLPPELLHVISSRLHHLRDFVRFHAVCKPWRSSHGPTSARKTTTDQFLPWLLAPNEADDDSLKVRFVFSRSTNYVARSPIPGATTNWVGSADGTAVRYITSDPPPRPNPPRPSQHRNSLGQLASLS
jgi:hypothetical protein